MRKAVLKRFGYPMKASVLLRWTPLLALPRSSSSTGPPLIERLSAISGAAPRVFWSNAGGYVDYYVNALAAHPLVNQDALAATRALLESRTLNGQRNPLYEPVSTYQPSGSGEVKRVRKLCCLRYLLDEFDVCGNCPLEGCDRQARRKG